MIGLLASLRVNPHMLDDAGVRVRYGLTVDPTIPKEAISEIRTRRRSLPLPSGRSGKPQLEDKASARILHIPVTSSTNVDVTLGRPTTVRLLKGRSESITELHFYADDPRALVARAREHLSNRADSMAEERTTSARSR